MAPPAHTSSKSASKTPEQDTASRTPDAGGTESLAAAGAAQSGPVGPAVAFKLQGAMGNDYVRSMASEQGGGAGGSAGGSAGGGGDGVAAGGHLYRSGAGAAGPSAHKAMDSATGGGGGEVPYRAEMEAAFGQDFSGVSAHTGATNAMGSMNAKAAARGESVAFAESAPSKETVAHELTHVVQSRQSGGGGIDAKSVTSPGDSVEKEANAVASRVASGGDAGAIAQSNATGGVARDGDPPLTQRIRDALDDDNESEAISLMGQCNATQANTVLNTMQSLAVGAFWNSEMNDACHTLVRRGGNVATALRWMFDEGTDWDGLKRVIGAANDAQLGAIRGDTWRDRFISEVGNDAMAELVDMIKLPLDDKIRWMHYEGTSWSAIKEKIEAAPTDQRAILATDAWRDYFGDSVVGNDEMSELVDLLPLRLAQKLLWMEYEGSDWEAMKSKINNPSMDEYNEVYSSLTLRNFFVWECGDDEMLEAVKLLGGTLGQQLNWMYCEGTNWEATRARIVDADEASRLTIYVDGASKKLFMDFEPAHRVEALHLLGGTPTQKLSIWPEDDLGPLLAQITPTGDWAEALVDAGKIATLLDLARREGDTWRAAVDASACLDKVIAAAPVVSNQAEYVGLFTLLGDATTRSRAQLDAIWPKLIAVRLMTAGQSLQLNYTHKTGVTSGGNTWNITRRPIPVTASDAAMAAFYNTVRPMPRMTIIATNTLQFAAREELFWWQTATTASTEWHPFPTPLMRDIPTSYAGGGIVTLEANKAGDKSWENVRTADGGTSEAGTQLTNNEGDVSQRHIGADSEGIATSVGGGEDRTATGGQDNRTTPAGLTYFENHVIHEFGHSVGRTKYEDVDDKGNDFAIAYAGWASTNEATFLADMWSATAAGKVTDGAGTDHNVTAAAIGAWAAAVLSGGSEPSGNTVTAVTGQTVRQKLDQLRADPNYASEKLMGYMHAVLNVAGNNPSGTPGRGYMFTGYTPSGTDVHIYCSRHFSGFAKYEKGAYDACISTLGWYSLSSPVEMFAEAYTSKYAGGGVPAPRNSKNWDTYFTQLENSPSIEEVAGAAPALATPAGAPAAGETAPPTNISL